MRIKITLWLKRETDKARLYSTTPDDPHRDGREVWIPRSVIEHQSKAPPAVGNWPQCEVTLPDWFVEKENL